jgi:hypothetical protein
MIKVDLTNLYCHVDDFCKEFEPRWNRELLSSGVAKRRPRSSLSLSEGMTIVIWFHFSGSRDFKHYYLAIATFHKNDYKGLVSYSQFVTLMKEAIIALTCFIVAHQMASDGFQFVDCTPLPVCHPKRISSNKVFRGIAKIGKSTMVWFYGFKLGIVINRSGELLSFCLAPGNTDDRKCLLKMSKGLFGKLFADKGFISQKLFEKLLQQGLKLVTQLRKKMKPQIMEFTERLYLRKRSLIESVFHQLKDVLYIDHSRHRSPLNFVVNLLAGLAAYIFYPNKPKLRADFKGGNSMNALAA